MQADRVQLFKTNNDVSYIDLKFSNVLYMKILPFSPPKKMPKK